jgi:hypothetical protein
MDAQTKTPVRMQADFSPEEWDEFCEDGRQRALALGNRGPMRWDGEGRLAADIVDSYRRNGFYVFTDVVAPDEVACLEAEFDQLLDNAPAAKDGEVDRYGRPVVHAGYYSMSAAKLFGRSEEAASERPVVGLVSHPLMMMDSALRVYAHPDILRMVEAVNGPDFIPFHESIFHKSAGEGPPTPWHQDGRTHWAADGESLAQLDGSGETHGFNLNVSWSHCTPQNCLWVVPGSNRRWRLANGGSFPKPTEVVPEAVPVLMGPGDCALIDRSSLHGSYRNLSPERRVTMVLGYHKRSSAIGVSTTNVHAFKLPGGDNIKDITYSEDYVLRRARMIALAIDARRQYYPDETPYTYRGAYIGNGDWNEETRAEIATPGDEYWQRDITL